jgi:enoyl-CoA hydratase/carnithine racemase
MMSGVLVDIVDGVAVVTIDRPASRNAIALETIGELSAALDRLERRLDVGALVLRGGGDRAFVSGGDLRDLASIRDEAGAKAMATDMRRLLDRLVSFPAPVIAALNGAAIGGGAEVAVAADIRLAADDVKIGFTQVRLAIMPAWGGAERLAELVGRSRALLMIATGEILPAREAASLGLIDAVYPRAEFDQRCLALATQLAGLPEQGSRSVKAVVAAARPMRHPHLEPAAVAAFARLWVSDAHWEAVGATQPPAPGPSVPQDG